MTNIIKINSFILIVSFFCFKLNGQSLSGTSGILNVPSARILNDGNLTLGFSYIPKPYFQRYEVNVNPGLTSYLTFAILPYVEIMFRYTHELNLKVNEKTLYFPDRMFSFRMRIIDEKKYLPATLIGIHDLSKLFGTSQYKTNSHYSVPYIVFSKNIFFKKKSIDVSIGYAFDFMSINAKELKNIFFGLQTKFYSDNIFLLMEHDSKHYNIGIRGYFFKRLNLSIGLRDLKKITGNINFKLN